MNFIQLFGHSSLAIVFCLIKVKYTFTGIGFALDCNTSLSRGNLSCFQAVEVGTDHTTNHFSTIGCRVTVSFTKEADLRLLQHLTWSSFLGPRTI